MLEAEGHEINSAEDVPKGYLAYLLFRPDVVLSDLHLPEGNGLELMKHIRRHNPKVKTIYISGDFSEYGEFLEVEIAKYAVSILKKPISKVELIKLLSKSHPGSI